MLWEEFSCFLSADFIATVNRLLVVVQLSALYPALFIAFSQQARTLRDQLWVALCLFLFSSEFNQWLKNNSRYLEAAFE